MKPPATAIDVLRKANSNAEIGYAWGGDNADYPAVRECLDRGWIVYSHDRSVGGVGDILGRPYQRRDIFMLTEAGRVALGQKKEPL